MPSVLRSSAPAGFAEAIGPPADAPGCAQQNAMSIPLLAHSGQNVAKPFRYYRSTNVPLMLTNDSLIAHQRLTDATFSGIKFSPKTHNGQSRPQGKAS